MFQISCSYGIQVTKISLKGDYYKRRSSSSFATGAKESGNVSPKADCFALCLQISLILITKQDHDKVNLSAILSAFRMAEK